MKVTSRINYGNIKKLNSIMDICFVKSVDSMKGNIIDEEVMPFDTGALQNRNTYLDISNLKKGYVLIKTDGPYARRLYFHPEFNFQRIHNANAQGNWWEPWISGSRKLYLSITFTSFLKGELKKYVTK